MDINQCFSFVNFVAAKEHSGRTVTPEEFNLLMPQCLIEFVRQRIGLPQDYRYDSTVPRVAWEKTQRITEDLRILKKTETLTVTSGEAIYPTDYMYVSSVGLSTTEQDDCGEDYANERPIEVVADNEWDTRRIAHIRKPTLSYPICKFDSSVISVLPSSITQIQLTYLRKPTTPVWGFTVNATTELPEYNPATSVDIELPEITHTEICNIFLMKIGVNLNDMAVSQYAQQKYEQGV